MKCFYHGRDFDGKCSGAIVKMMFPHCELRPIDYGDEFPWDYIAQGEPVYMVDYSLPADELIRLATLSEDFVWIDHHKSALEAVQGTKAQYLQGRREIGKAGCELTWEFFFRYLVLGEGEEEPRVERWIRPMPEAVTLLGRYDVWDHDDEGRTLDFQMGMQAEEHLPEEQAFWQELFCSKLLTDSILGDGEKLRKYKDKVSAEDCLHNAFETEIDGLKCIALNSPQYSSLTFQSVWDPEKYDAMLAFCWKGTIGQWRCSLYSVRDDVDVSKVAIAHGGGGHKGAAGFQVDELPFKLTKRNTK